MIRIICVLVLAATLTAAQPLLTPLETAGFTRHTGNRELVAFLAALRQQCGFMQLDTQTVTKDGYRIPVVRFVKPGKGKLKVLVFAQQHGNEQSGSEGALMLIRDIAADALGKVMDQIDLTIIPRVNPDGHAVNRRRNSNGVDLNRNHIILTETETKLIHSLYLANKPQVTVDVHEYFPFTSDWKRFGGYKNADETIGTLTNPNIYPAIIRFQMEAAYPFIKERVEAAGFSFFHYAPGGPPDSAFIRYSTFDVNDGRQSLGMQGSFSFIIEGKNGRDSIDRIERRATGQRAALAALLAFAAEHREQISKLVGESRKMLADAPGQDSTALTFRHVADGSTLLLPLQSAATGRDTAVTVTNFKPLIEGLRYARTPRGYLLPKADTALFNLMAQHGLQPGGIPRSGMRVTGYRLTGTKRWVSDEDDDLIAPQAEPFAAAPDLQDYYFMPLDNTASRFAVMMLEPESMLGLVQYPIYKYLLQNTIYPVFRVEE